MKVEVYSEVNEKEIEKMNHTLSPAESLIRCLDVLDFHRALTKSQKLTPQKTDDGINWIELSFLKK